jgi:hypothetical protein
MATVRVINLDRVLRNLVPQRLYYPAAAELIGRATTLGQRVAAEGAPKDTQALARSILADPQPLMGRVYTTLAYADVADKGRRPGSAPPPKQALYGWLDRHGIPRSAAWVIARAIGRRGVKGRFFWRAAERAVRQALPSMAQQAARAVESAWRGG